MSTKFEDLILKDIESNRPSPGIPGRLFYNTTSGIIQRDTGTAWDEYSSAGGGGGPVDETDLLFTDITTANVDITKHGLMPKLSNISTEFFNGEGAWAEPQFPPVQEVDLSFTDITTADSSNTKHGLMPKLSGNASEFFNGAGNFVTVSGGGGSSLATLAYVIDGGGVTIASGIKGDLMVDFDCTINQITMLADTYGNIVVDMWKDVYANFPPTVADTMVGSSLPTITSGYKSQDTTLSGWTTSLTAGDIIRFHVNSCSGIKRVYMGLKITKG